MFLIILLCGEFIFTILLSCLELEYYYVQLYAQQSTSFCIYSLCTVLYISSTYIVIRVTFYVVIPASFLDL
jgi:hypothetical protein